MRGAVGGEDKGQVEEVMKSAREHVHGHVLISQLKPASSEL